MAGKVGAIHMRKNRGDSSCIVGVDDVNNVRTGLFETVNNLLTLQID